jgi:addiction module HigA family antidote
VLIKYAGSRTFWVTWRGRSARRILICPVVVFMLSRAILRPMKNPPHPGHSIKDACLDPLSLSVTDAAKVLGVARHTLSRVIHGQAGISPEMAIRLEKAGWSNADQWLRVEAAYDLAQARRHEDDIKVRRYEPQRTA